MAPALAGIDVAYYLVHSMGSGHDFHVRDARAARAFGEAARAAGVQRLVYLGALGDPDTNLSEHLRSRQQTGDALREAGVPVTEFRAAVIVGAGSLSFEMIRYLTERLPIMICPSWVYTRIQPIAIRNVLDYLVTTLDVPESAGQVIEIGGANVITYGEMMTGYARLRGLRRLPGAGAGADAAPQFVLGAPGHADSLDHRPAADRGPAQRSRGAGPQSGVRSSPMFARWVTTRRCRPHWRAWTRAPWKRPGATRSPAARAIGLPVVMTTQDGMVIEHRQLLVDASPARVFRAFTALGGETGWLYMNWSWQLRGALDRLAGGVGMRRGRRHPHDVRVGDALDFWRVEAVEPDAMLLLRAEMKVPGRAWLQFQARDQEGGRTLMSQTAYFAPRGLWGLVYWYALYPIHQLIFSGMIRRLAARA